MHRHFPDKSDSLCRHQRKGKSTRQLSLLLWMVSLTALAAPPEDVVKSCLFSTARNGVSRTEIEAGSFHLQDDYQPGYQAEYLLYGGVEIGSAHSRRGDALLYRGRLYPLRRAAKLPQTRSRERPAIQVALAEWSWIQKKGKQYLCVSDQFDGIGRSGSFQKARFGYLLETWRHGTLYFFDGLVD
ncbi:hypothetical protein [Herbaspirillum aquaticum]|uniref:hypothetical protein n=1 Tax=Herbaspirillum aquaticum TaxID=568783 RepID=UPI0024DECB63|nr:hypothetical protein [Herbaspirillum aquaticum]